MAIDPRQILQKPLTYRQVTVRPLQRDREQLIPKEHHALFAASTPPSGPPAKFPSACLEKILKDAAQCFEREESSRERVPRWLKRHLAETTGGIVTVALPIYTILETGPVGMSHLESMNTRTAAIVAAYGGLAYLYSKGRTWWHHEGGITENSPSERRQFADFTYGGVFNAAVAPFLYAIPQLFSGGIYSIDSSIMAHTTVMATALGACAGSYIGPGMDVYRELFGIQEESRYLPPTVRSQSPRFKKILATAFTAASLAVTSMVYRSTHDNINYMHMRSLDKVERKERNIEEKVEYARQPALPYRLMERYYGLDLSFAADVARFKEERAAADARSNRPSAQ